MDRALGQFLFLTLIFFVELRLTLLFEHFHFLIALLELFLVPFIRENGRFLLGDFGAFLVDLGFERGLNSR